MKKLRQYFWIMGYVKKCWPSWLFAHAFPALLGFLTTFFNAQSFRYLFLCFAEKSFGHLYTALLYAAADFAVQAACGAAVQYCMTKSSAVIKSEMKQDLLRKVLSLPMGRLETEHSGQILSRFNQDVDTALSAVNSVIDKIILPTVLSVSYFAVVYNTVWEMGVFYTVVAIPIMILAKFFTVPFREAGRNVREKLGAFNARFTDILAGAAIIKQFSLESAMRERGREAADGVFAARIREIRLNRKYSMIANIFSHSFVTFPIILGCVLVSFGRAALPDIMFISRYTYNIRGLITMLMTFTGELQTQLAAADRLREALDEAEEGQEMCAPFVKRSKVLTARGVSVFYDGKPVLNDASVSAGLGEMIAVVGASGSGKSTYLKTLMRFAEYSGTIDMFGNDAKSVSLAELRHEIAYVAQDNDLFDGTIMENILFGKPDAAEDEVLEAARRAGCDEFVRKLPEGYETRVGENGANLSGGQRQRVSIARALLKDAPVLILDEATSALDYELENAVMAGILEQRESKAVIICTHRLPAIMNASRIYVLDNGKIVQDGTHQELISHEGMYRDFFITGGFSSGVMEG